jgi:CBS-domain-containing membrane protein
MQQGYVSAAHTDTLIRARQLMAASGQRVLPVADGSRLLGTVSLRQIEQIYRLLAAQQQRNRS